MYLNLILLVRNSLNFDSNYQKMKEVIRSLSKGIRKTEFQQDMQYFKNYMNCELKLFDSHTTFPGFTLIFNSSKKLIYDARMKK